MAMLVGVRHALDLSLLCASPSKFDSSMTETAQRPYQVAYYVLWFKFVFVGRAFSNLVMCFGGNISGLR